MSILFLFFAAQAGIVSLFEERRTGTLARILAGPVRPGSILAGKSLGSLALGRRRDDRAHRRHDPADRRRLGAAARRAAARRRGGRRGDRHLDARRSFAKTVQAAAAASSAVAITLGILGGTFAPTAQAPEVMATLALLTPHGWFLLGLGDMHGAGSSFADGLPAVAVLLAIGP